MTHRGQLEGGLGSAGSSAGYFVLIKEGAAFTALPAEQFYTFRPKQKYMLCLSDTITCKKAYARKPAGALSCLGLQPCTGVQPSACLKRWKAAELYLSADLR